MPRLLDLFCGAGGAAMGYYRAGFTDIVGVDIKPQPRYPFEFIQADALEYLAEHGHEFDAIHASPPCQGYSIMNNLPWNRDREYPLLILPTLELLKQTGKPYVLENVMGARRGAKGLTKRGLEEHGLEAGWLCGTMFGLPFYRHRLFASSFFWMQPGHPKHQNVLRHGQHFDNNGGRLSQVAFSEAEDNRGVESWPNRRGGNEQNGTLRVYQRASGKVEITTPGSPTEPGYGLTQWQQNGLAAGIGHIAGWRKAAEAMGIDWMKREELTQAIPPSYAEFIGKALMEALTCPT